MKKYAVFLGIFFGIILTINLVSAWNNYDDWYNNYWKNMWNQERDYDSGSGNNRFNNNVAKNYYKDVVETKHITVDENEDPWNYERIITTTTKKQEIERETKTPVYYRYENYNPRYYPSNYVVYGNKMMNNKCNLCNGVPCSSWRYKQPYSRYEPERYDYYPMYDDCLGYYNWRY